MLFENELLDLKVEGDEPISLSDEEINNRYTDGEVRIVTEQARYPLDTIKGLIESGKYNLRPDFQRRHRWNSTRKSRLIESFIMNVPIPPVFLYENEYSHYEVMDGLQRLTAVYEFYSNIFALEGLQVWKELNGKRYSELPEKIRQGIDRRYISSIVLLQETAKDPEKAQEMKQIVFERINSGGVKLEEQEVRNALYNGSMSELCNKLSRNVTFRLLIGITTALNDEQLTLFPIEDSISKIDSYLYENSLGEDVSEKALMLNKSYSEMKDIEFVLRFFAMRQTPGYSQTRLNNFFDKYLIKANEVFNNELLSELERLFNETVELVYALFGENAFYLYREIKKKASNETGWSWFKKPTTVVYDPMMFAASQFVNKKDVLLSKKEQISSSLVEFYKQKSVSFKGRNANRSDIENRKSLFLEFFNQFCEV